MQESLFSIGLEEKKNKNAPLAVKMRPSNLDEFVGQEEIVGKNRLLRRLIEADRLSSIILFGPAGCGKTTLARIIANSTSSEFYSLNAVTSGVKDIREVIDKAKDNLSMFGKRSILFIDEIHRFNKSQQDALLPSVEEGTIILIGATTQNPYFEINSPLISRSTLFNLKASKKEDIKTIVENALKNKEKGLGEFDITLNEDALDFLSINSQGDARVALNALELAFLTTPKEKDGKIIITQEVIIECMQKKKVNYDKGSDEHYNTISAFIKSLRGSDPNAALHYLAKMLYAGEDPKFIARRMIIFASEDISNANPFALTLAISTFKAVEVIGFPECRINLAHLATFLATSPKSNASYLGLNQALYDIEHKEIGEVPLYLRGTGYSGAEKLGHGVGYKYPHEYENHYVKQQYLPNELKDVKYYIPTEMGEEKRIKEYLENLNNK